MAHQYMPEIFHDPRKNTPVPPPTFLMYGPLLYKHPKLFQSQALLASDPFVQESF